MADFLWDGERLGEAFFIRDGNIPPPRTVEVRPDARDRVVSELDGKDWSKLGLEVQFLRDDGTPLEVGDRLDDGPYRLTVVLPEGLDAIPVDEDVKYRTIRVTYALDSEVAGWLPLAPASTAART